MLHTNCLNECNTINIAVQTKFCDPFSLKGPFCSKTHFLLHINVKKLDLVGGFTRQTANHFPRLVEVKIKNILVATT